MAIFAIITDLEILNKPVWYDAFTARYLSRPKPHITLIQPRLVEREKGVELMQQLSRDLSAFHSLFPIMDTAYGIRPYDDGTGLMIGMHNPVISDLQKHLKERIPTDMKLYNPAGQKHEEDFWPHLTMADQIPEGALLKIIDLYDLHNLRLEVRVHKILCTLPPDFSLEESFKEENYHVMLS